MNKKIAGFISMMQLIIALIMYFLIAYHLENDASTIKILPFINFEANLLRLLIYIVPGINIICGLFGVVFSTKGILIFSSFLELTAGLLTLYYKGDNTLMNIMGIVMIVLAVVYFIVILTIRKDK